MTIQDKLHDGRTRLRMGSNGSGNGHGTVTRPMSEVDIIVPVFNALEFVQDCIGSVLRHADRPIRIIVVNDGSDETCSEWLRAMAANEPSIELVVHDTNRGYTRAINSGLRRSSAPCVILLNSDTIVTPGWIAGLVRCSSSADTIGIVGPLSNAATWQSVPHVVDADGKFAVNSIPNGLSIDEVAGMVAEVSRRSYPRTPFVNGFCFLIKRDVLDRIGLLDEEAFPLGYGEENDYCIRAAQHGFELVIADDVFIYHAKSKSFGDERRSQLVKVGAAALREKHGHSAVEALALRARKQEDLEASRRAFRAKLWAFQRTRCAIDPLSIKLLFLLPVRGGGGGVHSVVQEAAAMRRLGVSANVAVRAKDHAGYIKGYPELEGIEQLLIPFTPDSLLEVARGFDVVVATAYTAVQLLERIGLAYPEILPAYYVQDYEPLFFAEGSREYEQALASYERVANAVLFAKTDWLVRQVAKRHGLPVSKVVPSLDHSVYFPEVKDDHAEVRIVAMVRPQTPRRAAARTMRVLREVVRRNPTRVGLHIFGCESKHPDFQALSQDFPFINYGVLTRAEVAALLRRCDVFVDLSDYQAFGRTGLEAMACGCATVLPVEGGTSEYATDANSVLVDSSDEDSCVERLSALVNSDVELRRLRRNGLTTASAYSVHGAAMSELNLLTEALSVHRQSHPPLSRRRLMLLPARNAKGEITAAGYVRTVYPWRSAGVQRSWIPEILSSSGLPAPGAADILLLQAGSPAANPVQLLPWLGEWRKAGGKLLFDLGSDVGVPEGSASPFDEDAEARLEWIASMADAVIVPNEDLRAIVQAFNPNVFVLQSYLDFLPVSATASDSPQSQGPRPVRIGIIGASSQIRELEMLAAPVRRIEHEFGTRVTVEVIGAFQDREPLFGSRVGLPKKREFPEYIDWLSRRVNWDIALLPVLDDERLQAHPDFTFFQYSALKLATVASDCSSCRLLLSHHRNGILTRNDPESWYEAIKGLVVDESARTRLAEAANGDVMRHFTVHANRMAYPLILDQTMALPRRLDTPLVVGTRKILGRASASSDVPILPAKRPTTGKVAQALTAASALLEEAPATPSVLQRKVKKLVNHPERFFSDSKKPFLRTLGKLIVRRKRPA